MIRQIGVALGVAILVAVPGTAPPRRIGPGRIPPRLVDHRRDGLRRHRAGPPPHAKDPPDDLIGPPVGLVGRAIHRAGG